jgi:type II secretory pathway pseudopilin PulG
MSGSGGATVSGLRQRADEVAARGRGKAPSRAPQDPRINDYGETLIELLIAMVVIGLAVTAILGALAVAVGSSTMGRNQARVQAALGSWAESLTTVGDTGGYRYTSCATAAAFPAPTSLPSGYTSSVTAVQYWNGTAWSSSCGTDLGLQKVTLRVTAPGTLYPSITQNLDVVVRRPCGLALSDPSAC